MKRFSIIPLALVLLLNVAAIFQSYNYLAADQFKEWIETDKAMIVVDVQLKDEFAAHHFSGSIETNSFPVKTDAQKERLLTVVEAYNKTGHDIVIICPRGGGGAKNGYSFLKSQGIPDEKLTILKGGIAKWPYKDMLVKQ